MSSLECIDDDFEEEIARSIKDVCLMVLGKDFDFDEVCRELQHQPIRLKFYRGGLFNVCITTDYGVRP